MAESFPVEILSGEDEGVSPLRIGTKHGKISGGEAPLLILDDDDATPLKSTPSFVPETPFSNASHSNLSIVKCTAGCSDSGTRVKEQKFSGISGLICLESDNEFEDSSQYVNNKSENTCPYGSPKEHETTALTASESSLSKFLENDHPGHSLGKEKARRGSPYCCHPDFFAEITSSSVKESYSNNVQHGFPCGKNGAYPECPLSESNQRTVQLMVEEDAVLSQCSTENDLSKVQNEQDDNVRLEHLVTTHQKDKKKTVNMGKNRHRGDEVARKLQLKEERKRKREEDKLKREALKAEAAQVKKLQKEQQKWEKGKFALKSITAEIDTKVVEAGSIGGYLLTRFAEKGVSYRVTTNPIGRSILWKMNVPEQISQFSSSPAEVPYILVVYTAEEFCDLANSEALLDHISSVQSNYPGYTVCCLTNKLMAYINKREQSKYKNPSNSHSWRRPPVEEMLSKLTTHFIGVHSRQCVDEAEVADHIVGLTCSLATCQFRKKLTHLSVNANGSCISKDFIDKHLIKKNLWLKVLITIPKVQPRFAVAIGKKYPTMRSLLNVYLDPTKSVHEKEFLLKDLVTEGALGQEERRVGELCSKRVYRILMAQSGNIITDDAEDGADFFD